MLADKQTVYRHTDTLIATIRIQYEGEAITGTRFISNSQREARARPICVCVLSVGGRIYYIHVTALTHRARRTSSKRDQRLPPLARLASRQSYTPPALARTCLSPEISDHLSS